MVKKIISYILVIFISVLGTISVTSVLHKREMNLYAQEQKNSIVDQLEQRYNSGYNSGYEIGFDDGLKLGEDYGYATGLSEQLENNPEYKDGYDDGYDSGFSVGYDSGFYDGYGSIVDENDYDSGYDNGFNDGYDSCYNDYEDRINIFKNLDSILNFFIMVILFGALTLGIGWALFSFIRDKFFHKEDSQ